MLLGHRFNEINYFFSLEYWSCCQQTVQTFWLAVWPLGWKVYMYINSTITRQTNHRLVNSTHLLFYSNNLLFITGYQWLACFKSAILSCGTVRVWVCSQTASALNWGECTAFLITLPKGWCIKSSQSWTIRIMVPVFHTLNFCHQ